MYTETINKCAATGRIVNRFEPATSSASGWQLRHGGLRMSGLGIISSSPSAIWWIPPSGRW